MPIALEKAIVITAEGGNPWETLATYQAGNWGETSGISAGRCYLFSTLLMDTNQQQRVLDDIEYNKAAFAAHRLPTEGGKPIIDSVFANVFRRIHALEKQVNKLKKNNEASSRTGD